MNAGDDVEDSRCTDYPNCPNLTCCDDAEPQVREAEAVGWVVLDGDRRVIDFTNRKSVADGWQQTPTRTLHPVYTHPPAESLEVMRLHDAVFRLENLHAQQQRKIDSLTATNDKDRSG